VLVNSGSIELNLRVASLERSPDFLNCASLLKSMAIDFTTGSDTVVGKDALLRDGSSKDLLPTIVNKDLR
jgi:hypothetical protein